jgi:predicted TIM-barrel fold metal-dependent hydrolase
VAGVIDAHVYLGRSIQGFGQDRDDILKEMDRLAIERSVLVPVRPFDYGYGTQNDLVAGARRAHMDRFYAVGRVDPRLPGAASEAARCLSVLEVQGLYLHPWEDAIPTSDHRLDPVMEVCAGHGVPILVAAGYPWVSEAPQVGELAGRFPQVQVIMTNGGQINISGLGQRNAWLALARHPNLYMTTSGVYREDFVEEVLTGLGSGRVLFGSQSPLFDQDFELHRLLWAHVDEPARQAALSGNAEALFGR